MNNKKSIASIFQIVAIIFLLTTVFSFGQTKRQKDSIINLTSLEIYKNPDLAIQKAKNIVLKAGNDIDYKIKIYKLISDAYSSKRDYEKSLEYVIKANDLLKDTKDELLKISIYNKTAIQYHQLKVYDKAIQYLDLSEGLIQKYPYKDSIYSSLGKNYVVRGFIYKEKLNCEIAIDFFNKGIEQLLKSKSKSDNAGISIAKYNKGNCYILLLNNKLAVESFSQAIDNAKLINALSLQAFAMKGLAKVYTLEGKYNESIDLLNNALLISSKVNDLVLNQEIYNGLSENYLAKNDWYNFKIFHEKYLLTQKQLKENERKSISESLRDKDKEWNLKLKNEIPNFYFSIVVGILIILISVLFLLKYKKKKSIELTELNNKIQKIQTEKSI